MPKMLQHRAATLLPVSEIITQWAIELMESMTLSHGIQMGDTLIAAAALDHRLPVLTANLKHFGAVHNQLKRVLDALRELITPPDPPKRPVGFISPEDKGKKTLSQAKSRT